ncbi:MAG: zinc ribbon domain-containing protein [Chloroflexi bacterium]|nr:zinc ribbon domain-containing protein [Chloroflexota bacterium]
MHATMNHEAHPQTAPAGAAAAERTCPHCGFSLRAGFGFCPGCGMRLDEAACASCGQPVEAAWKACAYCGAPLNTMNRSNS